MKKTFIHTNLGSSSCVTIDFLKNMENDSYRKNQKFFHDNSHFFASSFTKINEDNTSKVASVIESQSYENKILIYDVLDSIKFKDTIYIAEGSYQIKNIPSDGLFITYKESYTLVFILYPGILKFPGYFQKKNETSFKKSSQN